MSQPQAPATGDMPTLPTAIALCGRCRLPVAKGKEHDFAEDCVVALHAAFARLFPRIGTVMACAGCRATIWMVRVIEKGEKKVKPYDVAGSSHFLTCTHRAQFTGENGGKEAKQQA